jgi:hypothetical protein
LFRWRFRLLLVKREPIKALSFCLQTAINPLIACSNLNLSGILLKTMNQPQLPYHSPDSNPIPTSLFPDYELGCELGALLNGPASGVLSRQSGMSLNSSTAVIVNTTMENHSRFGLSTARLCVMPSRHEVGLVIVARDHVGETLETFMPRAEQAVALDDDAGRGHAGHLGLWRTLEKQGRATYAS